MVTSWSAMISKNFLIIVIGCIYICADAAPSIGDDDFGFDIDEDPNPIIENKNPLISKSKGIPDVTAEPGKLFQFSIPKDAFKGHVSRYEVKSPLPPWLTYTRSTFVGIPIQTDKPNVLVSVVARGDSPEVEAHDVFRIQVRQKPMRFLNPQCSRSSVVLLFYIDENLEKIQPKLRLTAIKNLSGFLGLNAVSQKTK